MQAELAGALMPRGVMAAMTALVCALAVLVHYEGLTLLSRGLRRLPGRPRPRILVLILSLLVLHSVSIWLFGLAFYGAEAWGGLGAVRSLHPEVAAGGVLDHVYFSAVVYTTVGFGEIVPRGALRALVGAEAITGLTLITWSASYTYLEMQQFWREGDRRL
jgi:hypothetical protein